MRGPARGEKKPRASRRWNRCAKDVRDYCGGFRAGAAAGIRNRHDHGSQYMSDDYQAEIAFLGMASSPSFVRQPECKRLRRTVHSHAERAVLWVRVFRNVEEAALRPGGIRERYTNAGSSSAWTTSRRPSSPATPALGAAA